MPLFVIVDSVGYNALRHIKDKNLILAPIESYLQAVMEETVMPPFSTYNYEVPGDYERRYASLKPLLMEKEYNTRIITR